MPDTGWLTYGSLFEQDPADIAWSNLAFTKIEDGNSGSVALNPGEATRELNFVNWGISLPDGAVPTGVETRVKVRAATGAFGLGDLEVKLLQNLTTEGPENKASIGIMPTSLTFVTYGSPTDDWGLTLTKTLVENSQFGFLWKGDYPAAKGSADTIFMDVAQLKVHYVLPGFSSSCSTSRKTSFPTARKSRPRKYIL